MMIKDYLLIDFFLSIENYAHVLAKKILWLHSYPWKSIDHIKRIYLQLKLISFQDYILIRSSFQIRIAHFFIYVNSFYCNENNDSIYSAAIVTDR